MVYESRERIRLLVFELAKRNNCESLEDLHEKIVEQQVRVLPIVHMELNYMLAEGKKLNKKLKSKEVKSSDL